MRNWFYLKPLTPSARNLDFIARVALLKVVSRLIWIDMSKKCATYLMVTP